MDAKTVVENIDRYVQQSREAQKFELPDWLRFLFVLACLKRKLRYHLNFGDLPIWGELNKRMCKKMQHD